MKYLAKHSDNTKISLHNRLVLLTGVKRRFFLYTFNKKYIQKSVSKCKGECLRCGACCKLATKQCPHLIFETDGKASCKKYSTTRMPNCVTFPIDQRDIKERNIVSKIPCGYSFENN